jgi:osmotically-inducible protein OsmY
MRTTQRAQRDIKKNILDTFYWDSRVNANNIDVEIYGGKATLIGSVPTKEERGYAEEDALKVAGVQFVENNLTVRFTDDVHIPSDLEVESNIRDIIKWYSDIDLPRITITVNAGFALLAGSVTCHYQKFRAQELTEDVIGVFKVDNRLTVVPTGSPADTKTAEKIIGSLKDHLGSDTNSLTIMVRNGIVVLTGTVPDELAYKAVENIIENIPGAISLSNLMVINNPPVIR